MKAPALAVVLLFLSTAPSLAQTSGSNVSSGPDRFTQHNWAQVRPDYGYLKGCTTGYRAFSFGADGYFVFNRNIHGSWRVTPQGSLILRTKSGQTISLSASGSTLSYTQRNTVTGQQWQTPISPAQTTPYGYPANTATATPAGPGSYSGNTKAAIPVAPGLPAPPTAGTAPSRELPVTGPGVVANPPYQTVASGALQFRNGDQFQECDE